MDLFPMSTQMSSPGPPLPHEMDEAVGAYWGLNGFFITGGLHLGKCPVKISECVSSRYVYELRNDFKGWRKSGKEMRVPRGQHVGIVLPKKAQPHVCQDDCESCLGDFCP